MKRFILWIIVFASGLCVFIPDPIPFIDEAIALAIFLKATSALGYDLSRFLPFFGKAKAAAGKKAGGTQAKDMTVDV